MAFTGVSDPSRFGELLRQLWGWIGDLVPPWVWLGLSVLSAFLFVVSLLCASWAVRRLPEDYLLHDSPPMSRLARSPLVHLMRNIFGAVLLLLGIAMLALPGQGLLTILAALSLLDFPRKRQLERRLILVPRVLETINHIRMRSGRAPLRAPAASPDPS
jgi:hypothetical protein